MDTGRSIEALITVRPLRTSEAYGLPSTLAVGYATLLKHGGPRDLTWAGIMKLYRINKLTKRGGLKKKHILAGSDSEVVQRAVDSPDCPVCDDLRDGERVGSII